jgi:hypothetical protein
MRRLFVLLMVCVLVVSAFGCKKQADDAGTGTEGDTMEEGTTDEATDEAADKATEESTESSTEKTATE